MELVRYEGEAMLRRALAVVAALALLLAVGASFASPSPARAQTASGCPASALWFASGNGFMNNNGAWRIDGPDADNVTVSFSVDVDIYNHVTLVDTISALDTYDLVALPAGNFWHFQADSTTASYNMICVPSVPPATATTAPTATATATTAPTATATATTAPTATGVPSVTPFRYFLPHINRGSDSNSHANP